MQQALKLNITEKELFDHFKSIYFNADKLNTDSHIKLIDSGNSYSLIK